MADLRILYYRPGRALIFVAYHTRFAFNESMTIYSGDTAHLYHINTPLN